ncbi:MAG: hypothetical protein K6G73_04540 [Marinilabiliaceae bacterium]|nr:hypothetical protein [Marinilabiliaceae bacterium]
MPYRRLPNTDQARLRALRIAVDVADNTAAQSLLFSQKLFIEAKSFLPHFEQAIMRYNENRTSQASLGKRVAEAGKLARLYLSHYIQVFNMCITRGEIKPEARELLGLNVDHSTIPDISSDQQLLYWGNKIVEGEERRSIGNKIYNPSIAVVKIKLLQFTEIYNSHRDMIQTIGKYHEKLDEIRYKADELILNIWNEVEGALQPIDSNEKRDICSSYGIVYFYRPNERQKAFLSMS